MQKILQEQWELANQELTLHPLIHGVRKRVGILNSFVPSFKNHPSSHFNSRVDPDSLHSNGSAQLLFSILDQLYFPDSLPNHDKRVLKATPYGIQLTVPFSPHLLLTKERELNPWDGFDPPWRDHEPRVLVVNDNRIRVLRLNYKSDRSGNYSWENGSLRALTLEDVNLLSKLSEIFDVLPSSIIHLARNEDQQKRTPLKRYIRRFNDLLTTEMIRHASIPNKLYEIGLRHEHFYPTGIQFSFSKTHQISHLHPAGSRKLVLNLAKLMRLPGLLRLDSSCFHDLRVRLTNYWYENQMLLVGTETRTQICSEDWVRIKSGDPRPLKEKIHKNHYRESPKTRLSICYQSGEFCVAVEELCNRNLPSCSPGIQDELRTIHPFLRLREGRESQSHNEKVEPVLIRQAEENLKYLEFLKSNQPEWKLVRLRPLYPDDVKALVWSDSSTQIRTLLEIRRELVRYR